MKLTGMSSVGWAGNLPLVDCRCGRRAGRLGVRPRRLGAGNRAWHLRVVLRHRNLLRLEQWLRRRRLLTPPDMDGPWGEVVAIVDRIYRRKQYHKSRVIGLLREFRRLTTAMPEGAILLGPEHEILWFNRRAADWLSLRRDAIAAFASKTWYGIRRSSSYLRDGAPVDGVIVHELRRKRSLAVIHCRAHRR